MFSGLEAQFAQSFIENNRWVAYLKGLGISFEVTLGALCLGVILGVLVAVIRTSHDQQAPGHENILLGILNAICKIYTTVIRGTPMMVQLLIMGFIVFASSRNLVMIAVITMGINSGRICFGNHTFRYYVNRQGPDGGRQISWYGLRSCNEAHNYSSGNKEHTSCPRQRGFITLFKDTSLVTVIGLADLTKVAIQVQAKTYQAFMPFIGIAVVYLTIVLILTWLLGILERRLRQSDRH